MLSAQQRWLDGADTAALVRALTACSPEFVALWERHEVARRFVDHKVLVHPHEQHTRRPTGRRVPDRSRVATSVRAVRLRQVDEMALAGG
jgi:hypothetical protein